jgi:sigma-70 region 2
MDKLILSENPWGSLTHYKEKNVTNEELAIEIQKGNKSARANLWEQVEHFVKKSAFSYYNALKLSGKEYIPDADDLISEGYIAMLEAVKYYDPDKDYRYITYLSKTLKKSFADVTDLRTLRKQNEPLNNCRTLNLPVGTVSGTGKYLKSKNPDIKVVAIQHGANSLTS